MALATTTNYGFPAPTAGQDQSEWDSEFGTAMAAADTSLRAAFTGLPWVNAADYGSDGDAIQAAYDSDSASSKLVVVPRGIWNLTSTLSLGIEDSAILFEEGAQVRWTGVTGTTPLIQITKSKVHLHHPDVTGSGSKGNGIGIKVGVDGTTQPHGCQIYRPVANNLTVGVEFGIDEIGSSSSGDNTIWGGRITNCVDGIRSKGFVNHVYGCFISSCDVGIHQTTDRNSGRIIARSCTVNQWADAAVVLDRGRGSVIDDLWAEHTATQSGVPTECIRIGHASHTVVNARIGTAHIHPIAVADGTPELYVLRILDASGLHVDHIEMTDEIPSTAAVRLDSTHGGHGNVIERLSIGDAVPAGWDASMVLSDGGATGSILIKAIPGETGDPAGTLIGAY